MTLEEIRDVQIGILRVIVEMCDRHGLQYYLTAGTLLGAVRHSGYIPWDDDIDIALPRPDFDKFEIICRSELPTEYYWVSHTVDHRISHNISKICDRRTVLVEEARENHTVELGVNVDVFPLDGVPRNLVAKLFHHSEIQFLKRMISISSVADSPNRSLLKRVFISVTRLVMNDVRAKRFHCRIDTLLKKFDYDTSAEASNYLGSYGLRECFPKTWIGKGVILDFEGLALKAFEDWQSYLTRLYGDYMTPPPPDQRRSNHPCKVWRRHDDGCAPS